ncbi:unnamed protein product [Withania somnifera]
MAKKKAFTPLFYLASIVFLPRWISFSINKYLESWIQNENRIHMILHFSTNIIRFIILSGYSILGNEKLVILNSWAREFLYNLSDTVKAFFILLLTDLCIGFRSPHGWELIISSIYKDFGFVHNDQIIFALVSTFPVILDTIFKYWIFRYFNRPSPSLVVIYHLMNDR